MKDKTFVLLGDAWVAVEHIVAIESRTVYLRDDDGFTLRDYMGSAVVLDIGSGKYGPKTYDLDEPAEHVLGRVMQVVRETEQNAEAETA